MSQNYVYLKSKDEALWTVGFYSPSGEWMPERDCDTPKEAGEIVAYLNGGETPEKLRKKPSEFAEALAKLKARRPGRYFTLESRYVNFGECEGRVTLDGDFTVEELETLTLLLRDRRAQK